MEANCRIEVIVETPYDTIIKNICKFDVIYLDIFCCEQNEQKRLNKQIVL